MLKPILERGKIELVADGKKGFSRKWHAPVRIFYPMKDAGAIIPEPELFGILMIPQGQAQQILGLPGQINQLLVDLAPGADEDKIKRQIEEILKPYGNIASYPRKDQPSHAILQVKLDGLRVVAHSLPFIFFLIAAGIQFVILTRLIRSQRLSIGVMKAIGYNNRRIMWHYTSYGLAVSLAGAVLGTGLGMGMASILTALFIQYFNVSMTSSAVNTR